MRTMEQLHLDRAHAVPIAEAILAAAFLGLLGYVAFVAGPAYRAATDRAHLAEMARETIAHCTKLGSPPPSEAFTLCSQTLEQVRNGQAQRTQSIMTGF
ncbi:MAG: hypothetical protein ACRCVA_05260 [Phreatobacter sp.]